MSRKVGLWYKLAALFLVLALVVPILAACGDDNNKDKETPTPAATTPAKTTPAKTTPVAQPTVAPTAATPALTPTKTVSKEPVKIGVISPYSGPAAMAGLLADVAIKVVMNQVEKMGGILGGRSIQLIKYDDKGDVVNTMAGYKKLILEDKVSAVLFGGGTGATLTAASDAAEENKVPVFSVGSTPGDISGRPYTIRCVYPNWTEVGNMTADFVLNKLKPKTVALLCTNDDYGHNIGSLFKKGLEAAGVKIVYEQYAPQGTIDFTPYLTRIKYEKPDVLIADLIVQEAYAAVFTQIMGLGGWGDIKLVTSCAASSPVALKKPAAAEGTYHWVYWAPGLPYPGAKEMEQAYMETVGKLPASASHYYALWVAIKAIELAGSDDPAKIAQAARSGKLQWESPGGPYTIKPDGTHSNSGQILQCKGGKLVPVE
ncbi:MAG: ABC transporter substrate-binding protein [Dehalococcoidia bacterium]